MTEKSVDLLPETEMSVSEHGETDETREDQKPISQKKRYLILKANREFSHCCQKGNVYRSKHIFLYVRKKRWGRLRLGFTCSKQYSKAYQRNRCKRRLRAAVQRMPLKLNGKYDIVLMQTYQKKELPYQDFCQQLESLLNKAGLLKKNG